MTELSVCIGSACHVKGSYKVFQTFERLIEEKGLKNRVSLTSAFCMGHCQSGVSVMLDGKYYSVSPDTAESFFTDFVE
ncbi:MAG: (2Fe-2S) ferredoxin domain-containing protein [Clostridiales bacterium]|nr:(2Fe-2S) ferredoxin domain-containing protein [Clostridiales bacterium]